MTKIHFIEHDNPGYPARTIVNAKLADFTIAIGVDSSTLGELLTKRAAGSKYSFIQISPRRVGMFKGLDAEQLASKLRTFRKFVEGYDFVINIAGNGIYSFRPGILQQHLDTEVKYFLSAVFTLAKFTPTLIRSGGQTGMDEAGIKAAVALGIPALCLAPKGWVFRDRSGTDIADEKLFKERFK